MSEDEKSSPNQAATTQGTAGKVGTAVNMACNIMGGALLVLPTAMHDTSVGPGLVLVVAFGCVSASTMVMLADSAERLQCFSYRTLVERTTHVRLAKVLEVMLFLYTYGVLIEYGRIIVDSMPSVVEDLFHASGVIREGWLWLLLACAAFFPLTALPALAKLKWTSVLGLVTILFILVLVVVRYFDGSYRAAGRHSLIAEDVSYLKFTPDFFKAIPVMAVSFSCHYNIPFYYKELEGRSPPAFHKVMLLVFPFLIFLYAITGTLGYFTFGDASIVSTKGNIVNAFRSNDLAVNIGRLGLFFHFVTAYPIVAIGCRNCLNNILFGTPTRPQWQYIVESFGLVSSAGVLAYLVSGIGIVVDIIGSLFGVYIVVVIPSVVYIGAQRQRPWRPFLPIFPPQADSGPTQINANWLSEERHPFTATVTVRPPIRPWIFAAAHAFIPIGIVLSALSFAITIIKLVE